MGIFDVLTAVIHGIVQGITEWLPISSTGHMILAEQFLTFHDKNGDFSEMFLVVVQFGSILAVVLLFWKRIFPVRYQESKSNHKRFTWDMDILMLWVKIIIACIPAAIVGILFEEEIDEIFYKPEVVGMALIVYGVLFIVVEIWNQDTKPLITNLSQITYRAALIIGLFQLSAAIIPGTSRSGATILGALIIGFSRPVAAEFTFFLAIPVMFGASLLKCAGYLFKGNSFGGWEITTLLAGMFIAFIVSLVVIKFLLGYIRKHDFKIFGYYRIVLGAVVLIYAWTVGFAAV